MPGSRVGPTWPLGAAVKGDEHVVGAPMEAGLQEPLRGNLGIDRPVFLGNVESHGSLGRPGVQ